MLLAFTRLICLLWCGRSATVVLAYLVQHHQLPLITALTTVKARRDVRPNNGFLKQLVRLEQRCLYGERGDLLSVQSEPGKQLLANSVHHLHLLGPHFSKQTNNRFCGVQSCCIVLNACNASVQRLTEENFWSESGAESVVSEAAVCRAGMTVTQCGQLLALFPGVEAVVHTGDTASLHLFREQLAAAANSNGTQFVSFHAIILFITYLYYCFSR